MSRFLIAPTGHTMPLSGGEICVGSDPSVQIPVRADFGLLPRHFAVAEQNGGWYLGAYEGAVVWVNGLPVTMTELHDGDRIVAGQLELTYRDEQTAANAQALPPVMQTIITTPAAAHAPVMGPASVAAALPSLLSGPATALPSERVALSWTPLPMDGGLGSGEDRDVNPAEPRVLEKDPTLGRSAWALPSRVRTPAGPPVEEWSAADRYNPQKWSALKMGGLGLLVTLIGLFLCYVAMFELDGPVKPEDLAFKDAQIISVMRHQQRKRVSWTEIKLAPAMQRVITLPDDLQANPAWGQGIAKIGFIKKHLESTKLNVLGDPGTLGVVTLEVGGRSYRSLAKHNAVKEGQNQMITLAGPCIVIGGVFLLVMGWEKRKAQRG